MRANTARKTLAIAASSLLLAVLAGCGGTSGEDQAGAGSTLPSQAELDSLRGEGLLRAAREASKFEFWAHYRLMQATGMEAALGGEEQAIAALAAVSSAFERSAIAAQSDAPRLIRASFDGNGLDAGVMGVGYGLFGGLLTGGMLGSLSREEAADLAGKELGFEHADGSAKINITEAGLDTTLEHAVNEGGVSGRVKTRIHLDACPDPDGKLVVTIDTESQMSAGGKGGLVKISYRRERWLDDDARLSDAAAEDFEVEMSGAGTTGDKLSFAERRTVSRDGRESGGVSSQEGFDIFHLEDAKHTEQLRDNTRDLMRVVADAMLMGMGQDPPYESGRCIDLNVRSDPTKRAGARPNTAYTLFAEPRARLDGAPARGTVTATLDGTSALSPTDKVKADARFDYANPDKKEQTATVAFESRSRRGVGRAALVFDTKKGGYRVVGGQNDFKVNALVCSLGEPFHLKSSAGIVMHMSGGENGGSYTVSGQAAGVAWSGNGRYTLAIDGGEGGRLNAQGITTITSPMGRFSDSVEPTFSLTPAAEACAGG